MAGEWYDCHAPEFIEGRARALEWCARYNATPYSQRSERRKMLEELFGAVGTNVSVGDNVSINLNCTFIDCNRITIGNDVLIAPCVHLATATHPVELADRLTPNWTQRAESTAGGLTRSPSPSATAAGLERMSSCCQA